MPRITARQVVRVLEKLTFRLVRQKGSHAIYKNAEGKRVTVPIHFGRILHPRVLKSILNDAGLSTSEFLEML